MSPYVGTCCTSKPVYTTIGPSRFGNGSRKESTMSTQPHLILVVDDEEDIRSMVGQALGRLPGYEVHEAVSKAHALELLGRRTFDLVLTDLSMEHANAGIELLE